MAFTKSAEIFPAERMPHLIEGPNDVLEKVEELAIVETSGNQ